MCDDVRCQKTTFLCTVIYKSHSLHLIREVNHPKIIGLQSIELPFHVHDGGAGEISVFILEYFPDG